MMTTFIFVFYMATNIIPANVDHFKIEAQNPDDKADMIILDFNRDNTGRWKVVPRHKADDVMFFKFDEQANLTIQDGLKGKEKTYPLLEKMSVEKNHRKWKKVTNVSFKTKEKTGLGSLVFNIKKSGKRQRTVQVDAEKSPQLGSLPAMIITWE